MRFRLITIIVPIIITAVFTLSFSSCNKDDEDEAKGIDREMYEMALSTEGFTFYKFSSDLLDKSSGSGHDYPFLRTRYNDIAANHLDSAGKIIEGISFAEGSFIVKELYNNTSEIGRYAMLLKDPDHEYADENGWVWGYVNADESVAYAASEKGGACISCHQQSGSIDYMLMNKFFP